jgi:hypothetical protein
MSTNYEIISQQFKDADSDEKRIIILQDWIAHLEEDNAELYNQILDLKTAIALYPDDYVNRHSSL